MFYRGNEGVYEALSILGSGGEGSVYALRGEPDKVLKVFHQERLASSELHRKIRFMVSIRSSIDARILPSLAWPSDVVKDSQGRFVGFVMPKVAGYTINECYIQGDFSLTYAQRIRIARNLCATVDAVHSIGQAIGDFNPNNILVNPKSGAVTIVDTDSFHLTNERGVTFRCSVGLGDYLAPEIQGMNLSTTRGQTYSRETDRFSLAIHIFCLLMGGAHPYATRQLPINASVGKSSVVSPQRESLIKNGQSPHFSRRRADLSIPAYCPSIDILPPSTKALFIRAFDTGHSKPSERPSASEWYKELRRLEDEVGICKKNKTHSYPSHARRCPWCVIEAAQKQGRQLPSSSSVSNAPRPFVSSRPSSPQTKQGAILTEEKTKFWLITGGIYLVFALIYIMLILPAIDSDIFTDKYTGLRYFVWLGIPAGFGALWYVNDYFMKKWFTRPQKRWEIPAAVSTALAACILTPVVIAAALAALLMAGLVVLLIGMASQ